MTYTLESTVSEKLDAIIRFMEVTGRMKDFYDIYYLATSFEFEGRDVHKAIFETLTKRETPYEWDSIRVINRLCSNDGVIGRWTVFCKKVLKYELDLNEVIQVIISFVDPPFQAIISKHEYNGRWDSVKREYEKLHE